MGVLQLQALTVRAQVFGVDRVRIQPKLCVRLVIFTNAGKQAKPHPRRVPPNLVWELDDIERDWTWKEGTADLIFCRDPILCIRDFERLIAQSHRYA